MNYIKLTIAVADDYQEPLISELEQMEFDGFQQLDDVIITYVPEGRLHIGDRERIEHLLASYLGDGHIKSEETVADQNWNETWEQSVQAQRIGQFFVRPTWVHETPPAGQLLLEIDPKMSFGTGYHETTRLMLRQLPSVVEAEDDVLDAGTGTGVLAIAAIKIGAGQVFAFDIDDWSITNAKENIYLNEVSSQVRVEQGTHTIIPKDGQYDVILANIHANVIADMLPVFANHLHDDGVMLLSGLLETDEDSITQKLQEQGFAVRATSQENEWIAIEAARAAKA